MKKHLRKEEQHHIKCGHLAKAKVLKTLGERIKLGGMIPRGGSAQSLYAKSGCWFDPPRYEGGGRARGGVPRGALKTSSISPILLSWRTYGRGLGRRSTIAWFKGLA